MKIQSFRVAAAVSLIAVFGVAKARVGAFQNQNSLLAITNANVIDGVSNEPLRDVTVIVRAGKIEQIGKVAAPAGAAVIDLRGKWLLPGFIDAHAHISDLTAARVALQSGVTTARDLGVNNFFDIGVRELNHNGAPDLPDIVAAGYHVRPRPAELLFVDIPKLADLMGKQVNGPDNLRRIVRAQIERGVDVIKILTTERAGLPDTDPRKRVFSDEEIAAIVDEARKSDVYVTAHAHGDEGAYAAVKAGVRSIEHGTYIGDQTLALMKERGTYLVPTIATVVDLVEPGGDYDNPILAIRGRHMLPRVRETAAKAWKMGIKLVAGTDTGYGPQSSRRMPHEVIELAQIGMSPMDAIKAATSVSAELLGIGKRTGSIKSGFEADFIAIERDPIADVKNLQDILLVINNGKPVVNRLSW
ncbi:MAG TPA: amidohydrolase family protein [Blastocatellia bacterium]|nr:amidohydrolase family protein [Blastocatellia bacterium]